MEANARKHDSVNIDRGWSGRERTPWPALSEAVWRGHMAGFCSEVGARAKIGVWSEAHEQRGHRKLGGLGIHRDPWA